MNKGIKRNLYLSPKLEVLEIKAMKMLCSSPGSIEREGSDLDGGEDINFY